LLRVVIPGVQLKRGESTKEVRKPVTKPTAPLSLSSTDFPTEFNVEVNGEAFSVKISPILDRAGKTQPTVQAETPQTPKMAKKD